MEFRRELKIVITQVHLIVLLVLVLHLVIPVTLNNFQPPSLNLYTNLDESSGEEFIDVDLQSKDEEVPIEGEAILASGEVVEVIDPDIFIFRPYQESADSAPKVNKLDELADMLAAPAPRKAAQRANVRSGPPGAGLSNLTASTAPAKPKTADGLSYEKILSKNDIVEIEKNKLKTAVQGLNSKFQKCYDDELFRDELLTGKLVIALKSNDVVVQFNGIGKNQSIESLKACVKKHCSVIKVPAFLQDNTIKFNFNLTGSLSR